MLYRLIHLSAESIANSSTISTTDDGEIVPYLETPDMPAPEPPTEETQAHHKLQSVESLNFVFNSSSSLQRYIRDSERKRLLLELKKFFLNLIKYLLLNSFYYIRFFFLSI